MTRSGSKSTTGRLSTKWSNRTEELTKKGQIDKPVFNLIDSLLSSSYLQPLLIVDISCRENMLGFEPTMFYCLGRLKQSCPSEFNCFPDQKVLMLSSSCNLVIVWSWVRIPTNADPFLFLSSQLSHLRRCYINAFTHKYDACAP